MATSKERRNVGLHLRLLSSYFRLFRDLDRKCHWLLYGALVGGIVGWASVRSTTKSSESDKCQVKEQNHLYRQVGREDAPTLSVVVPFTMRQTSPTLSGGPGASESETLRCW